MYKQYNKLRILIRFLLVKAKVQSGYKILKRFGYDMLVDISQPGISSAIYMLKYREVDHVNIYADLISDKKHILDLGANIGYYVLLEASESNAEILCVEPDPRNLNLLRANLSINGISNRVSVLEAVIGEFTGRVKLSMSQATNLNKIAVDRTSDGVEVQQHTLDEIYSYYGAFDCMRMDVEGAESLILSQNAKKFLLGMPERSIIFLEVHPGSYIPSPESFSSSLDVLSGQGFTHFSVISAGVKIGDKYLDELLGRPTATFSNTKNISKVYDRVDLELVKQLSMTVPKKIRYVYCEKAGAE